jgi:hypothetical protein
MKDIQKDQKKKRYIYSDTYIKSSIMSSHKKKSNKQQEHVDFPCQNRYNKYLQRKRKRNKNKAKIIFIFSCFLLNKRQEKKKKLFDENKNIRED